MRIFCSARLRGRISTSHFAVPGACARGFNWEARLRAPSNVRIRGASTARAKRIQGARKEISAESVLGLYRLRWQIEMKFKTLKSVIHLGRVPVRTDQALRVHVLAKLLIALLIESLLYQGESFSPWGYPLTGSQCVATHALPS